MRNSFLTGIVLFASLLGAPSCVNGIDGQSADNAGSVVSGNRSETASAVLSNDALDDFPTPQPSFSGMSPTSGPAGTAVTLTGSRLNTLACTGGAQISKTSVYYDNILIGCTYNASNGSITVDVPSNATESARFNLRQQVDACPPLHCNQEQIISSSPLFTFVPPPPPPPGFVNIINQSQVTVTRVGLNGVAQAGQPIPPGGSESFRSATGSVSVAARFSLGSSWVCDGSGTVNVSSNQTSSIAFRAFTAGEVLTNCLYPALYDQRSYVDENGFHTVTMTFYPDSTFAWTLDGSPQTGGRITSTSLNGSTGFMTFTLSGGDTIQIQYPFGLFNITINTATGAHPVQLIRAQGWPNPAP